MNITPDRMFAARPDGCLTSPRPSPLLRGAERESAPAPLRITEELWRTPARPTEELVDFQPHANGVHELRLSRVVGRNVFIVRVHDTTGQQTPRGIVEQSEASAWAVMLTLSRVENPMTAKI